MPHTLMKHLLCTGLSAGRWEHGSLGLLPSWGSRRAKEPNHTSYNKSEVS